MLAIFTRQRSREHSCLKGYKPRALPLSLSIFIQCLKYYSAIESFINPRQPQPASLPLMSIFLPPFSRRTKRSISRPRLREKRISFAPTQSLFFQGKRGKKERWMAPPSSPRPLPHYTRSRMTFISPSSTDTPAHNERAAPASCARGIIIISSPLPSSSPRPPNSRHL